MHKHLRLTLIMPNFGGDILGCVWHHLDMRKRSSSKKSEGVALGLDVNELAASIIQRATEEGKNPAAVLLGRMGGLKGGVARANALSKKQRSRIAKKAARARWSKVKTS